MTRIISEAELLILCDMVTQIFRRQPNLLELKPPMIVCGDIHGQYSDLLRVFENNGFPTETNYLFLGDYVDRGAQSIETIALLFAYKCKYPENLFMLRGNHECENINRHYGFRDEVLRRYNSDHLWQSFQKVFKWMPIVALIGKRILAMHGGLSPQLKSLDQLRDLPREAIHERPSLSLDLLWSDPSPWISGWQENTRGASYIYGPDIVAEMCKRLNIDLVVRAHQVVQHGFEFFANFRLVTLFTAPHYAAQYNNDGAVMSISEDLTCKFVILHPES